MDPITHALTSLAMSRAVRKRLPRFGTALLVISGVAADIDFVSYFGGPVAFLRFHHAVLHSLLGSVAMCCFIAAVSCFVSRERAKRTPDSSAAHLGFVPAFCVCAAGAAVHVILDLASGIGVRLLWPFGGGWQSWDLLPNLDIWILLVLVAGLSLPHLVRLVSEEIGERKRGIPGRFAALVTLVMMVLYIGGREMLHSRAMGLLESRDYHREPPQKTAAFPSSTKPFAWRGVVSTAGAIDELNISLLPGANFDPDRAVLHYKPEDSSAIAAAQNTPDGRLFLNYARFPLATIEQQDTGFNVMLRDVRFPAGDSSIEDVILDVQVDPNSHILQQRLRFARFSRQR